MAKVKPMMNLEELKDLFETYCDEGEEDSGRHFERRTLTGGEWEVFDPWKLGINMERYEYQLAEKPAIFLCPENKKMVCFSEGDARDHQRSIDFVRLLSFRCRSCRKAKKELSFDPDQLEDHDDEPANKEVVKVLGKEAVERLMEENNEFGVEIHTDGSIKVGCADFSWDDVNAFAKKMGWWK